MADVAEVEVHKHDFVDTFHSFGKVPRWSDRFPPDICENATHFASLTALTPPHTLAEEIESDSWVGGGAIEDGGGAGVKLALFFLHRPSRLRGGGQQQVLPGR